MPNRRDVIKAGALALGGGLLAWPARAAGPVHRMKLGSFEITIVSDGTFPLPLSFLLPDRDPAEINALLATNNTATTTLPPAQTNVVVVRTPRDLVLIDTGGGARFLDTLGRLASNLEGAGFPPEAFTHVVLTHGHPDHLWGTIDDFDEPRFAKARHVISAAEHDFWRNPDTVNTMPEAFKGLAAGSRRILGKLDSLITRLPADGTITEGLTAISTPGHTPGHVSVMIASGTERLLVGGDVLGNPIFSFQRPDWHWGSDVDAPAGARTRARLLDTLTTDRIRLSSYHLPWPGLGRVERAGNAWRFVPD
jgi:glyoxylase-like metal-dependent hydrolase (beta-lactamase superfamily II)